jgi:hypothetical protein
LAIGDDAHKGHAQRLPSRVNQVRQVVLRGGQQTTSQEDLGGETIAQHPQHRMTNIRLQAIQGQDDAALGVGDLLKTERVSQRERHQCIVAVQEMLHRAGSNQHPAAPQLLMNLWETTVVGIAQCSDQGDNSETTRVLGEGHTSLFLGPVWLLELGTHRGDAATNLERETSDVGERRDGPVVVIGRPHWVTAERTVPE